ncbi:hypothetical protein [Roseomonas sp. CECT 9278]|uniref:hypothetical protein n=1 Tax=Roseomonas sp. CECT 9278 TaxID=2845823 RepID=UPI001E4AFD57|nr:hypothetical protein [Roseomonas sp. CECT 9278]
MADAIDGYVADFADSKAWGQNKENTLAVIRREIGLVPLRDLSKTRVIAWLKDMEGRGPATRASFLSYLTAAMRGAKDARNLPVNVNALEEARSTATGMGLIGRSKVRTARITFAQAMEAAAAARDDETRDLITLLAHLPLRMGEALQFSAETRHGPDGRAQAVRRKDPRGPKAAIIPLPVIRGLDLAELVNRRIDAGGGRAWPHRTLVYSMRIRRLFDRLGLENTAHDLRAMVITEWLMNSVPLPVVQRFSGHTGNTSTTLRVYSRVNEAEVLAALTERMGG